MNATALTLLPYQSTWVADKSRLKLIEKGRRIGLSWCEAYDDILHAAEGRGNIYYQSYNKDMTSGFIDDAAEWGRVLQAGASAVNESLFWDEDIEKNINVYGIRLSSGKVVEAMTSSPRAFRSKGRPGDRAVIDEAAFIDNLGAVLKAALAFLVWGGEVRVISTHHGEASKFNTLLRDVRDGMRDGSVHKVTFQDAINDGLYRRICQITGEPWNEDNEQVWMDDIRHSYGPDAAEELDCIPSKSGGAWLPWEMIRSAEDDEAGIPGNFRGGVTFVGVDVARRSDLWVAVVLERVGDVLWTREIVEHDSISFREQYEILDDLALRYRPLRIAIDQTGMGEAVVEEMQHRQGRMRVEGVLFSAPRKLDLATYLKQDFEDHRMRIPRDENLRSDLHSIKSEPASGTQAPRIAADSSQNDGHGDRFWAYALASSVANSAIGPIEGEIAANSSGLKDALDAYAGSGHTIDYDNMVVRSVNQSFTTGY